MRLEFETAEPLILQAPPVFSKPTLCETQRGTLYSVLIVQPVCPNSITSFVSYTFGEGGCSRRKLRIGFVRDVGAANICFEFVNLGLIELTLPKPP